MRLPTIVVREDILRSWMHVADYSKSQLAEELDVSKGRVSQLFKPQVEPSTRLIARLLLLTKLPFNRLFMVVAPLKAGSTGRASRTAGAARRGQEPNGAAAPEGAAAQAG